jgi:hypothetical protein
LTYDKDGCTICWSDRYDQFGQYQELKQGLFEC